MLYKMHERKLGDTEKTGRINGISLTIQVKFGMINMLGGHVAVFFAARKQGDQPQQNDNPWSALLPANQGLSVILNI